MPRPGARALPRRRCHAGPRPRPAGHRGTQPERAVQICVNLALHALTGLGQPAPETMGQAFDQLADTGHISADPALRLRKAVGFRNIAVHNYSAIDWAIVHAIATRHLDDFEAFARHQDPPRA
ncbi:MAG: type VII toxin-antitoxin system HepT family RNase toxin [Rhodanobacter sp.]